QIKFKSIWNRDSELQHLSVGTSFVPNIFTGNFLGTIANRKGICSHNFGTAESIFKLKPVLESPLATLSFKNDQHYNIQRIGSDTAVQSNDYNDFWYTLYY